MIFVFLCLEKLIPLLLPQLLAPILLMQQTFRICGSEHAVTARKRANQLKWIVKVAFLHCMPCGRGNSQSGIHHCNTQSQGTHAVADVNLDRLESGCRPLAPRVGLREKKRNEKRRWNTGGGREIRLGPSAGMPPQTGLKPHRQGGAQFSAPAYGLCSVCGSNDPPPQSCPLNSETGCGSVCGKRAAFRGRRPCLLPQRHGTI